MVSLRGRGSIGVASLGGWEVGAVEEEPTAVLPRAVARAAMVTTAAVVVETAAAAAREETGGVAMTVGLGLELPAGGGEEQRTLGLKVCPSRVFIMAGQEKKRRWRGGLQTGKGDLKLKG